MNDHRQLGHGQISALLTQSAQQLDEGIASALKEARIEALERAHAPAYSLSAIGRRARGWLPHTAPQWVAAAVVFTAVLAGFAAYWPGFQDYQNLDLAILTSDQSMDSFVDNN
jgi:hypothetical protein